MIDQSVANARFRSGRVACCLLALTFAACASKPERPSGDVATAADEATLIPGLSIGNDSLAAAEYQVASIYDLLITSKGEIWLLDGVYKEGGLADPQIRVFDADGKFLRRVGRHGEGPGEYLVPEGLAELNDGRIVLRDGRQPSKVEVFTAGGEFVEDWMLPERVRWPIGAGRAIQTDRFGTLWLPSTTGRPGPDRKPSIFILLDDHGVIRDSTPFALTPQLEVKKVQLIKQLPGGGQETFGAELPFQPRGIWAWSPEGHFAVARSDVYRIEMVKANTRMEAPVSSGTTLPGTIVRGEALIGVSEAERNWWRDFLKKIMLSKSGGEKVTIPEIAEVKPMIKSIDFTTDGRLLVWVAKAAQFDGEQWAEPGVLDMFEKSGQYLGRIAFPPSFYPMRYVGDRVWGIADNEGGDSYLQEYRIKWP